MEPAEFGPSCCGKRGIAKQQVVCRHLGLLQRSSKLSATQHIVKFEQEWKRGVELHCG